MTQFKTILMTAALLAVPSVALAQVSTDAVTDKLKDKAVEGVMDNMTTDDAMTAGKTILKGGSKEDAAMAVVKGRAEGKVESMTGTEVDLDDLSKDGMMEAGKDVAMEKAKGSATKYTTGASSASVGGVSTDGVMDAGKEMAMEKAKGSATSYGEKAAGSATTYGSTATPSSTQTAPATAPAASTLNCPSGTKDAGDGTCMITGNWNF